MSVLMPGQPVGVRTAGNYLEVAGDPDPSPEFAFKAGDQCLIGVSPGDGAQDFHRESPAGPVERYQEQRQGCGEQHQPDDCGDYPPSTEGEDVGDHGGQPSVAARLAALSRCL